MHWWNLDCSVWSPGSWFLHRLGPDAHCCWNVVPCRNQSSGTGSGRSDFGTCPSLSVWFDPHTVWSTLCTSNSRPGSSSDSSVFCDILPSSGGRDDFSTPIHFRAISALRIIACVHRRKKKKIKYECGMLHFRGGHMGGGWVVKH